MGLRRLVEFILNPKDLSGLIDRCLRPYYESKDQKCPENMNGITFGDFLTIIPSRYGWSYFESSLGNQNFVRARLERLNGLRNGIFHFRYEVTPEDYDFLANQREWIYQKINREERKRSGGENGR